VPHPNPKDEKKRQENTIQKIQLTKRKKKLKQLTFCIEELFLMQWKWKSKSKWKWFQQINTFLLWLHSPYVPVCVCF